MRRIVAVLAPFITLTFAASSAVADPLVVRGSASSIVVLDYEGDFFRLAGDGFAVNLIGADTPFRFLVQPRPGCDPCRAGDIWNPGFRTDGEIDLGSGNAQFGTSTYPDLELFGTLDFAATPQRFAPPTSEFFFMRAPFTFTGQIRGMSGAEQVFVANVVGAGNAFRVFDRGMGGNWLGGENQLQYRFADGPQPVPEPATLLLLGTGAAMTAMRARRKRG